ncbi:FkbM family methyltransferase [soil metagenome]
MNIGHIPIHDITRLAFFQLLVRTAYPFGSVRRVRRGPLKNFRLLVSPGMGFTFIWGANGDEWKWVQLIGEGDCVYDIGAHCGQSTLYLAQAVGRTGHVVAFEPVAANYDRLVRNLALNALEHVVAVCAAAAQSDEEGQFEMSERQSTRGRLVSFGLDPLPSAGFQTVAVKQVPLDSYKARGWPAPTFLKIDVEGGAPGVLAGAREMLQACRPTIYIELHSEAERAAVRDLLRDHDYRAYSLDGQAVADPTVQMITPLLCRPATADRLN